MLIFFQIISSRYTVHANCCGHLDLGFSSFQSSVWKKSCLVRSDQISSYDGIILSFTKGLGREMKT